MVDVLGRGSGGHWVETGEGAIWVWGDFEEFVWIHGVRVVFFTPDNVFVFETFFLVGNFVVRDLREEEERGVCREVFIWKWVG